MMRLINIGAIFVAILPSSIAAAQENVRPADNDNVPAIRLVRNGPWLRYETANFRVWCQCSAADVIALAKFFESERLLIQEYWADEHFYQPWQPACEVVVHGNAAEYSKQAGSSSDGTSGFCTIQVNQGRIVFRRIDLFGEKADWLASAFRHELTHVVVADLFRNGFVPPWANEGMATLSEPHWKQQQRSNLLRRAFSAGPAMRLRNLVSSAAPVPADLRITFYGQSQQVVRLLVGRRGPRQFVSFVQAALIRSYDAALQEFYDIDCVEDLEQLCRPDLLQAGS